MAQNIKERILEFLENKDISKREFYLKTGLSNGFLDKVDNIGSDKMEKILSAYPLLNLYWLVTGEGDMLKSEDSFKKAVLTSYGRKKNQEQMNLIPVIDIKAAANYNTGYTVDGYIETLDKVLLPTSMIGQKKHFLFQNKGESMHPTIYDSDYVFASFIERSEWSHIPDNFIYVIVTNSRGINIKRIKKSSKDKKFFFRCKSDNRSHPAFTAELEDIIEIWKVACKLSFNLPNENENLYNKVDILEERLEQIESSLKK